MPAPRKCSCEECPRCKHRAYMNEWYRRKSLAERREWVSKRDQDLVRKRDRERYQRDKGRRMVGTKRYIARYPEKRQARAAVAQAVRSGRMVRQPCEECGYEVRVHAHHDDYSKPLEVRWLCQTHHAAVHKPSLPRLKDGEEVR